MTARPTDPRDRLIVAVDVPTVAEAERLIVQLGDNVGVLKIGLQLLFAGGLDLATRLAGEGKDVFLDVKLLDIGNTVASAVENIAGLGVRFATIHAYPQAMRAAVAARGDRPLQLLGVTVLTSMDNDDFAAAGYAGTVADRVAARAADARAAGMNGVVASPAEIESVRRAIGEDMVIITPGIRPAGADHGDQKRVATPADAIRAGADYLVIGRPITAAADPASAASAIVDEMAAAS